MIYEMRYYTSKRALEEGREGCVIFWENKDTTPSMKWLEGGKLLKCIGYSNKRFKIPAGVETVGKELLVDPEWDIFNTDVKEVIIPKSVKKIEEGAFNWSDINKITVHPDSPCAIVKNGGLYTKDGSTLLFAFKANANKEFVVEDGTKRIGLCALENPRCLGVYQEPDGPILTTVVIPASVEQIAFDEERDWAYECIVIKAPKGSYAIKFAKKHKVSYIEI